MKTPNRLIITLFIASFIFNSCSKECENVDAKEEVLLADVSDPELFQSISDEIMDEYPKYATKHNIMNINTCEKLIFKMGYISTNDRLVLKADSIYITKSGLSQNEIKKSINPMKIGGLIKEQLTHFQGLTTDNYYTSGTSILNTILKVIDLSSETSNSLKIIVFSDMVMNNEAANFYRRTQIPKTDDEREALYEKTVDHSLLEKLTNSQVINSDIQVIIVQFPNKKINSNTVRRDINAYWRFVFEKLQIDVKFVDSLSNL